MKNVFITSVLALMLATGANAKNIYVSPDGSASNNGESWDSPISDLGTAYSKASKGDVIFMAGGTYVATATINMVEGVDVYGGFAKGETSIENRVRPNAATEPWKFTNETVITSGTHTFRLVDRVDKTNYWETTIIDGITFKDNVSTDSRVLYLRNSVTLQNCQILNNGCTGTVVYGEENTMVRDCYFSGNKTSDSAKEPVTLQLRGCHSKYYPGNQAHNCVFEGNLIPSLSIYNTNDKDANKQDIPQESDEDGTLVAECVFRHNQAACITVNNQWDKRYLKITNCLFENNASASLKDAGLVLSGSSLVVPADFAYNTIRNNSNTSSTNWRNSIVSARGKIRLTNNLIINNSSDNLLMDLQGNDAYNNTIANNKGTVYVDAYSTISNSIVANNEPTHKNALICAAKGSYVEYCASNEEPIGDNSDVAPTFENNIIESNYFVAPTSFIGAAADDAQIDAIKNADYSLNATSACVNAGAANYYEDMYGMTAEWMEEFMSKDIAGNTRIVDGKINMGAYQGGKGTGVNNIEKAMDCIVTVDAGVVYISSEQDGYATLYNINGAMAASEKIAGGNATIPVVREGLYLVKVVTNNQTKTFKVVIK